MQAEIDRLTAENQALRGTLEAHGLGSGAGPLFARLTPAQREKAMAKHAVLKQSQVTLEACAKLVLDQEASDAGRQP